MPKPQNPDITEREALEKALSELVNNIHPSQEDLFEDERIAQRSILAPEVNIPTPEAVLHDVSVSFWLKDALRMALKRDPVDAARDAGVLARVLENLADRGIVEAQERLGYRNGMLVSAYPDRPVVATREARAAPVDAMGHR